MNWLQSQGWELEQDPAKNTEPAEVFVQKGSYQRHEATVLVQTRMILKSCRSQLTLLPCPGIVSSQLHVTRRVSNMVLPVYSGLLKSHLKY